MKHLVEAYEIKAQSSKHSATSQVVDLVRDEIGSMLEQVINDGLRKGVMNTSMLHNFLPRRRTVMYSLH